MLERPVIMVHCVGTIPAFTPGGVLPPYTGTSPANGAAMAPFSASMEQLADRFGTSPARLCLLEGLLRYRAALGSIGLTEGFQWVDGSFIERIEATEGRDPRDIDVVTFYRRPPAMRNDAPAWRQMVNANMGLFRPEITRLTYNCDAYVVDLDAGSPSALVKQARYWFGLFSHKRVTSIWKGLLQVPIGTPTSDAAACAIIAQRRVA